MKTKEQVREIKRAWRLANPEKVKEMAKKSYQLHKEQRNADARAWVEKNKEHSKQYHKEYQKTYYLKNKEAIDIKNRKYATENPQAMVRNTQKYVSNNKEKVYGYGREYNQTVGGGYRIYRGNALKKKNEFVLSLEDFTAVVLQPCRYCGEDTKRIGIDRIDNTLGYTKENSAPCCKTCNYMKKNHTVEDFLTHITKIYEHNNQF
jgi:hypothetical protein